MFPRVDRSDHRRASTSHSHTSEESTSEEGSHPPWATIFRRRVSKASAASAGAEAGGSPTFFQVPPPAGASHTARFSMLTYISTSRSASWKRAPYVAGAEVLATL